MRPWGPGRSGSIEEVAPCSIAGRTKVSDPNTLAPAPSSTSCPPPKAALVAPGAYPGARAGEAAAGLDAPIRFRKGVGPRRAACLERLGIVTLRDLLFTPPRRYTDRTTITPIAGLVPGSAASVVGQVVRASVRRRGRARGDSIVRVRDGSGTLEVVFWGQSYLARSLAPGMTVALHGEVARFRGLTMNSPEFEVLDRDLAESLSFGRIVPTYRLTEGVSQRWMRELVREVMRAFGERCEETLSEETLPEPLSKQLSAELELLDLPGLAEALAAVHAPDSLAAAARARRRLAFEELLELMLALAMVRGRRRTQSPGLTLRPGPLFAAARASLPFQLTGAQEVVLAEILADMALPNPMHRLLEGDVGSGKTVVALLAALAAIDSGHQAAIMAPTEILAAQHARTALRLVPQVRVVLLTGTASSRERTQALAALARGDGHLAIGTHALFQSEVHFRRLGLVVVDEQHRFGVRERAALAGKGRSPDLLVMTATPIPRSLALTVFGDLDLSVIDERPPGRRPARTTVVEPGRRPGVYRFLAERLARGEQALVITPRIEADPASELAAAAERFAELKRDPILGAHPMGLLHGRLAAEEKEAVMAAFRRGALRLLVTTTVVEVGVDVAGVTVIVIEHPERFGLGQLHQLRGRAGRAADRDAFCMLMVTPDLARESRARLERFARTDDGFEVAELDLAARGPGELLGDEQHGFGSLRVAHPFHDRELVGPARSIALGILARDSELAGAPALRRAVLGRLASAQKTDLGGG